MEPGWSLASYTIDFDAFKAQQSCIELYLTCWIARGFRNLHAREPKFGPFWLQEDLETTQLDSREKVIGWWFTIFQLTAHLQFMNVLSSCFEVVCTNARIVLMQWTLSFGCIYFVTEEFGFILWLYKSHVLENIASALFVHFIHGLQSIYQDIFYRFSEVFANSPFFISAEEAGAAESRYCLPFYGMNIVMFYLHLHVKYIFLFFNSKALPFGWQEKWWI